MPDDQTPIGRRVLAEIKIGYGPVPPVTVIGTIQGAKIYRSPILLKKRLCYFIKAEGDGQVYEVDSDYTVLLSRQKGEPDANGK